MNRWTVLALAVMAMIVAARHVERLGLLPGAEIASSGTTTLDPQGVQVAQAELLLPVASPPPDPSSDGGALAFPDAVAQVQAPGSGGEERTEEPPATIRQQVPLNPEPPLPAEDRPRKPSPPQGPQTELDPHQLLFEPGETRAKSAPRTPAPEPPRKVAERDGPLTEVDPRQMLFEPGEPTARAPRREPTPEVSARPPQAEPEPLADSSNDAETKARIMKRLLRVMELAGEKR
jgi:hypothetical protein